MSTISSSLSFVLYMAMFGLWTFPQSSLLGQQGSLGSEGTKRLYSHGALIREDTTIKKLFLCFTGGDFADGGEYIKEVLQQHKVKAHFFFTGDFYREQDHRALIRTLVRDGHYLGPHSDRHLLYADWKDRDSTLVTREEFTHDLLENIREMETYGIVHKESCLFIPPYEWHNRQISEWSQALGVRLINYSPGTLSTADYTTPDMGHRYVPSQRIFQSILDFESSSDSGMNGFILLLHIGTHPDRQDKFYFLLPGLITTLLERGYHFDLLSD